MDSDYSAVIEVKTSTIVCIQFTRPLSPETGLKLESLKGDNLIVLSEPFLSGSRYLLLVLPEWDAAIIAQMCLNILLNESFEAKEILCKNFVPSIEKSKYNFRDFVISLEFQRELASAFWTLEEGANKYRIVTPFKYKNGTRLAIFLKKTNNNWVLSDGRYTLVHTLSNSLAELCSLSKKPEVLDILAEFGVKQTENYELLIEIERSEYIDASFKLLQCLLKVIALES